MIGDCMKKEYVRVDIRWMAWKESDVITASPLPGVGDGEADVDADPY